MSGGGQPRSAVYTIREDGTVRTAGRPDEPFLLPDDLVPNRLRQGAALGLLLFITRTGAKPAGRSVAVREDGVDVVVTVGPA